MNQELHVVALSGGKDSTALALRLAEIEPRDYTYLYTPTLNEPEAMVAHWDRLGKLLGKPLVTVSKMSLAGLIYRQKALPNWRQRWCTRMLKIEPYAAWLLDQPQKVKFSYVGIRADEPERESGDYSEIPGISMRFPMREWGWGLGEVINYLSEKKVVIPKRTDCKLCFYQRLIEWWELWKEDPKGWAEGEALEEFTGHTFRSPGRDSWPAAMKDLRARFEAGDKPRETRDAMKEAQCRVCRL